MKFSIGDNILIKRSGEEGHVTAFIDKLLIEVEVNGTTFPVYIDDIDHPYLKWFTDKNKAKKAPSPFDQFPAEKIEKRKERLPSGIYLSFLPVFKTVEMEEVVDQVKIFLLNELDVATRFEYDARIDDKSMFRHEGGLHAFGNMFLHSIDYATMNDQPRFNWNLTDKSNTEHGIEAGILRIRPAKLFDHISRILAGKESSFNYLLIDGFKMPEKSVPEPISQPVVRQSKILAASSRIIESGKYELDLHIEQLLDDTKGLSNAEIIRIQLETLQRYLQIALVHRQEKMVVIHGLGKGRLREEVHNILKNTPEVARYKNEWSGRYGFGATEILFKY